jgi:hypothetical protein
LSLLLLFFFKPSSIKSRMKNQLIQTCIHRVIRIMYPLTGEIKIDYGL